MLQNISTLRYPTFKLVVLGLLTLNVFIYGLTDTATKTLDALVWLVLLILYELETNKFATPVDHWLPKLRSSLIMLIVLVFISYFNSKEWLDVINSILWFILIALLEIEVRWPEKVSRQPKAYWLTTVTIFSGLLAMVMAWLWKSAWLDAYDAVLWIVAFGTIEVDIFQVLQPKKFSRYGTNKYLPFRACSKSFFMHKVGMVVDPTEFAGYQNLAIIIFRQFCQSA